MTDLSFNIQEAIDWIEAPGWVWMWGICAVMFLGCKVGTIAQLKGAGGKITAGGALRYVFGWVGMDARPFARKRQAEAESCCVPVVPGITKAVLGAIIVWGIAPLFEGLVAGWMAMVGMVLLLHFGLFHLVAAVWNRRGVAVKPIMNRPLHAESLAEFWGARWNRAFNELMYDFVCRPTVCRIGVIGATMLVFVVSGLIHDVVISVPAGAGYGLPTSYFLMQGVGLLLQRTKQARKHQLHSGWRGRIVTFTFLLAPLPLLFHAPFIERVILPFMRVIGAGTIGGCYD